MAKLPILFGVFFIISAASAFLFPPNNEITYNFVSLMQVSTEKPTLFTSQLLVNAKLTVKTFEKQVEAVLSDVDYSMYNGEGSHVGFDTKTLEISQEAKSITQPFTIEYEKNGKVSGIKTQDGDNLWSVNIKKAIASTLQLDVDKMLPKIERTYGFYSDESTVHGMCNTLYSVLPDDDDNHFWVKKYNKPMMCKGFKWDTDFKIYAAPCSEGLENPISLSSNRLYEVTKKENGLLINRVETMNTILMAPFRGNSDMYSLMANQTLILVKAEELKDTTPGTFSENTQHLKMQCQYGDSYTGSSYDMTGGIANYNETVLIDNARKQLNRVIEYLDYTQTHFSKSIKYPDIELNILLLKLRMLNGEQMEKLYDIVEMEHMGNLEDLVEKDTTPLLELTLPQVGTHASNMFIVKLIAEKDVPDKTAINLLQRLPFHVRNFDDKLVKALMSLCDNENVSESVKSTAKIAASNVIHFITMKNSKDDIANFYTDKFIDDFTKSEKYIDKLTYFSALANIKTRKTFDFLEHLIMNDKPEFNCSRHMRTLAIWRFMDEYEKSVEYYDKIYWPILEDEDEDTETRVAVMFTLMMYNPSINAMMKIHRLMEAENDDELYNLYYTALKDLSTSKLPCNRRTALNAKMILAITKKRQPTSPMSFNFNTDYFDSIFGFGEMMRMVAVKDFKDNKYVSSFFQYSPFVGNLNINEKALYVHLADEDEFVSNRLNYMDRVFAYSSLLTDAIFGTGYGVSSTAEFIWSYDGQITRTNISTFYGLNENNFGIEKNQQNYDFNQAKSGVSSLPTDSGFCSIAYLQTPSISRLKDSEITTTHFRTLKFKAVKTFNPVLGLGFYNPFADTLHGIQRSNVRKFYFPLDIFGTVLDGTLKLTFNHTTNDVVEDFGFLTSVSNQVYSIGMMNDNDKLKSACADCNEYAVITKGKKYRDEGVISRGNLDFLGISFKLDVFDCETDVSERDLNKLYEHILNRDDKNFGHTEPLYYLLTMAQSMAFLRLSPLPGMCALRAIATPDHPHATLSIGKLHETNEVDFHYGFKYEMFQNDGSIVYWGCQAPQNMTKYDATVSCTYKRGDKILKACFNRKMYYGKEHLHKSDNIIYIGNVDDEKKCPENPNIEVHVTRHETEKLPDVFETIVKTCTEEVTVLACIARHVISQKLTLDVKYEKISSIVDGPLASFIEWIKDEYAESFTEVREDYTKDGNLRINLMTKWKDIDMEVITPNEKFRLENVKDEISETVAELDMKDFIYNIDTDVCRLEQKYYYNAGGQKGFNDLSSDWSQIAADDCNCPDQWELFVKRQQVEDVEFNRTIIPWDFRIHSSGDNLELRSNVDALEVYLNDKLLEESEDKEYFEGVWFKAKLYKYARVFVVSFKNVDRFITLEHHYERAKIILPNDYFTNECHANRA